MYNEILDGSIQAYSMAEPCIKFVDSIWFIVCVPVVQERFCKKIKNGYTW